MQVIIPAEVIMGRSMINFYPRQSRQRRYHPTPKEYDAHFDSVHGWNQVWRKGDNSPQPFLRIGVTLHRQIGNRAWRGAIHYWGAVPRRALYHADHDPRGLLATFKVGYFRYLYRAYIRRIALAWCAKYGVSQNDSVAFNLLIARELAKLNKDEPCKDATE